METRRLDDAMAMQTNIESLILLVNKMEACYTTGDDASRRGEQVLLRAREYLAAVKTENGGAASKSVAEPERSPLPSPTSSENVLVGVLKRENASLLAKIRRLESDAKRIDDKTAWGGEQLVKRLKNQCADAVAEKNRLEKQCADAIAEKNRFEALYVEAEADKRRLEAQLSDTIAAKNHVDEQFVEVIAEKKLLEAQNAEEIMTLKNLLEKQCVEAAADKTRLEKQCWEAITEKTLLEKQCAEAVGEKNRLEAQCVEAVAENNCLGVRCLDAVAEKNFLEKQCAETVLEKTRLVKQCLEAAEEKNSLKAELATERSRAGEMRTTIGQLTTRLAQAENKLLAAKTHSITMLSPLTRGKRSGTLETSGTDTDESDSPMSLSMLDLCTDNEDSDQSGYSRRRDDKKARRSTMKINVQVGEGTTARRRSGVRRRSIIGSMIDTDMSASLDATRACPRTRVRCQSDDAKNQLTLSMRVERAHQAQRANAPTSAPHSVTTRETSKSVGRCRPIELHSSQSSQQQVQLRPRWRL